MQFIYIIKMYIIMIHIQYKNMQLLSANTDKHSYDSLYSLPIYHTSTEVKYFYTYNINQSINRRIIPLRNIGHPQDSFTLLYSWQHT